MEKIDEILTLTVPADASGKRLDSWLCEQFPDNTRSFWQKQIRGGACRVDNKEVKSGYELKTGSVVEICLPSPEPPDILPENIPLDILFEDDDILVINKPKGMVVHPAAGHACGTLVNALLWHCRDDLSGINGVLRPGIVHRIDQDTTGSLIVCKNDRAHNIIAQQLAEHSSRRCYKAIIHGRLKSPEGVIDAPIGRHPADRKKMAVNRQNGKNAVTHYEVLETFEQFSYIRCRLETGRTHQIRVHLSSIGHPLLGDTIYGSKVTSLYGIPLRGQTLHAETIGFIHPTSGEYMEFTAPLPDYFQQLLEHMRAQ